MNQAAVRRVLALKRRSWRQGLIVIADHPLRLRGLVDMADPQLLAGPLASWPGPYTWLLPARPGTPTWLRGQHDTVAVRVSAHPLVQKLCHESGTALVSTSANSNGRPPLRRGPAVLAQFGNQIDCILDGHVGVALGPSTITDAATNRILRNAGYPEA